jgi:putative hydrolase of the HAD superfamily
MINAVVFDWFGTLAQWLHGSTSNYTAVFLDHGHRADPLIVERYHSRWDGVDHVAHSTSRDAYLAWTRYRVTELARECGVPPSERAALVEAIIAVDQGSPMAAFPEVPSVLAELQRQGIAIGVCSNWGWDLDTALDATGLASYVDVAVTSARAGYRKPHPAIYAVLLEGLGMMPAQAVFVGDSWGPDVLGPLRAGMTSVHVCRDPTVAAPELVGGSWRIGGLDELLGIGLFGPGVSGRGGWRERPAKAPPEH